MALEIVEYANLARDAQGNVIAAGEEPAVAGQQVTIGGGSLQSAAFQENTRFLLLHATAAARLAFGANPTASATSPFRMDTNQTVFVGVNPHVAGMKLAVING